MFVVHEELSFHFFFVISVFTSPFLSCFAVALIRERKCAYGAAVR